MPCLERFIVEDVAQHLAAGRAHFGPPLFRLALWRFPEDAARLESGQNRRGIRPASERRDGATLREV